MAPIKKRTTARARIAKKTSDQRGKYAPPSPTHDSTTITSDPTSTAANADDSAFGFGAAFKLSKQDKRTIKHNQLLHKVREAGISKDKKVKPRRRRPGKKLDAAEDLGGLGEALAEVEEEWEGVSEDEEKDGGNGSGKMKMKTLKTRPGAMKRKARMEGMEVQRFGRNLAQMMGSGDRNEEGGEGGDGQKDRWTALRTFIGSTMERDKAFG